MVQAAIVLAALVSTTGGGALALDWFVDEDCPGQAQLEQEITEFLPPGATPGPGGVRAWGLVRRRGPMFELELEIVTEDGRERHRMSAGQCAELTRFSALLIAGAIDPLALPRRDDGRAASVEALEVEPIVITAETFELEDDPEPAAVEAVEPLLVEPPPELAPLGFDEPVAPAPEVASAPARPTRVKTPAGLTGVLMAEIMGSVNALPIRTPNARVGAGLDRGRFRIAAHGTWWPRAAFRSPGDASVGGDMRGWTVSLSPCGLLRWERMEFPLCGVVAAGSVRATGVGVSQVRDSRQPWVWLGAEGGLAWWVRPRLGLQVSLGVGASLLRPNFTLEGSDAAFVMPAVFGTGQLGLATRFGTKARDADAASRRKRAENTRQ
ncbi:MAG: hypothetical protein KC457_07900 [Myxococcales bacterium]|nr:hypothetical protein [Myxococcales bacterium]